MSTDLIKQVQCLFRQHLDENPQLYDRVDAEKVFTNDYYTERCLQWKKNNVQAAAEMVRKCFEWRNSSGVISKKDEDFPKEFYQAGGIFEYAPDKDGNPTLYMRIKMIKKIAELDEPIKDFVAYQIFKLDERVASIRAIVLIFDCSDIGWSNVHLDLLRHVINLIVNNFTWCIKNILVIDVPWVLNAAQKIVFAMLPDEAKRIVLFKKRAEITDHINVDNLPEYLGGNCTDNFCIVPPKCVSLEDCGQERYGLSAKQINKLKEHYKQLIHFDA